MLNDLEQDSPDRIRARWLMRALIMLAGGPNGLAIHLPWELLAPVVFAGSFLGHSYGHDRAVVDPQAQCGSFSASEKGHQWD